MTSAQVRYAQVLQAVASGTFVAFAAGSIGGEPGTAWIAAPLVGRSAERAYSDDRQVRAAQGIGAIAHVRRHARQQGFKPV